MKKANNFELLKIILSIILIAGFIVGIALKLSGISQNTILFSLKSIIRLGIGMIILLIDAVCIWAIFRPYLISSIYKNGLTTDAVIKSYRSIPIPSNYYKDSWTQITRLVFTLEYQTVSEQITKEFDPTCLTSLRDLYPLEIENGKTIPVKYLEKHPKLAVIDVEKLKAGAFTEFSNNRKYFIVFPLVISLLFFF